jgi:SAM-dependent methyltransferase
MTFGAPERATSVGDFNAHAGSYSEEVQRSIAFSGGEVAFFVRRKAEHLVAIAQRLFGDARRLSVLDAGCGVGATDEFLADRFGALHAVDVAAAPVAEAARKNTDAHYTVADGLTLGYADASFDLAFAVCVMHHVVPEQRGAFVRELRRIVRPGGAIVVFEHNPLNPLTRLAVSRCPFDEGVELISRRACARLLTTAGLEPVESGHIIFTTFDARFAWRLETMLRPLPLGAQHYVAARR